MAEEFFFVDGSSVGYPIYAMNQAAPETTATLIVDRIRALTCDHPHAAICCDSGRSFRYEIDQSYKAHRPESDAVMQHQFTLAYEQLARDGYSVWSAKGFEADDLIASAVKWVRANGGKALIASADKDLLQLVDDDVQVKSLKNGERVDAVWVEAKFGVPPALMRDYLTLVGDSSDNVVGAHGIGPKKAVALLKKFSNIENIYAALDNPVPGETKLGRQIVESLTEFRERWPKVRELITLRDDVPLPFAEVAAERTPTDIPPLDDVEEEPVPEVEPVEAPAQETAPPSLPAPTTLASAAPSPAPAPSPEEKGALRMEAGSEALPAPAPGDWTKQLEPRSMSEAARLATYMHSARLFAGYGTPHAVLSTILAGRELGFQSIASLRAFHVIDGRHALAADAMRGLVLRSGVAKYFRIVERAADHCTWETWRNGDPDPIRLTYTITQARTAWQKDERAWNNGPYTKNPEDMLSARASSKLARLVYADILFALYAPEELRDEEA